MIGKPYDSTDDTLAHIDKVREMLWEFKAGLVERARLHDASKLLCPEKEAFDILTPRLKGLTYGSDEYRASIREMQPAIDYHYSLNAHHPEHRPGGIGDMDLLDIVEMFCDWKAATTRHADGDMQKSIVHNQGRFAIAPQLAQILENTRQRMGW